MIETCSNQRVDNLDSYKKVKADKAVFYMLREPVKNVLAEFVR